MSQTGETLSLDPAPADAALFDVNAPQSLRSYLRDVWARREYLVAVPLGELRAQNFDTVLGNVWHVLNPLLQVGVYFLVFGMILNTSRGVDNFLTFLAVGVFMYRFTQRCGMKGAGAIVSNDGLIKSIHFPRLLLPAAIVVEMALAHVPAMLVMLLVALGTGEVPSLSWLILLVVFGLQLAFNLGLASFTARVTHVVRDFENTLPFLFRIVFYMSGIIYPVEQRITDPFLQRLFDLNPVFALVTIARGAVFGEPVSGVVWLSALGWSVVLLVAGLAFFKAGEHTYGRA